MGRKKTKLELTWIGKENQPKLEPRILIEDPELSHHAPYRVSDDDIFDNKVIFGDNLLALKALEQEYSGQVKCIYIDPPFNTDQAFEHYDDSLEHSIWLGLMKERIEILYKLLSPDGTLCVHIDDNELGYLIALTDEIFGRNNRTYIVTFKQSSVSGPKSINPGLVSTTSYIIFYAKNKSQWSPHKIYVPTKRDDRYSKYIENIDGDYSKWHLITLREALALNEGLTIQELRKRYPKKADLEPILEEFVLSEPHRVVRTARVAPKDIHSSCRKFLQLSQDNRDVVFKGTRPDNPDMYFLNGEQLIFYSSKVKLLDGKWVTGEAASTIWDDLLSNNLHKEGQVHFPKGKKPEGLIKRILELFTDQGDMVLDSFAGSGTTGAVAHKMHRKWVMIELKEHCLTHVAPRLTRVVNGLDDSGVTSATAWKGGGGFRYYKLGPSLIVEDEWGNPVINKEFNPAMLAEAMCKLEGFEYAPSDEHYWIHGKSTETDFIYVTTQFMSREMLTKLSDEVGPERSLLICCSAFRANPDQFPNLTIKKIPKAVMKKCEWGRDDYSLEIKNLPEAPLQNEPELTETSSSQRTRKFGKGKSDQQPLFDLGGGK